MNTDMKDYKDDEIDLIALSKKIFDARRFVVRITAVFFFVGVIVSVFSPVRYKAGSVFVPQLTDNQNNSPLGGLASLAGVNLTSILGNQPQEIAPALYPNIMESTPYRLELLDTPVDLQNQNLRTYITSNVKGPTVFSTLKKYTIGLPGLLLNRKETTKNIYDDSLFRITEKDQEVFDFLDQALSVEVDDQNGLVVIDVELGDRLVAAKIAKAATNLLQQRVIDFKTQTARENLRFTQTQFNEKKIEFEQMQDSIANFQDKNLNITSSFYQNKLKRLEARFSVVTAVFQELAGQVEQAKIQVNKNTPIFTIVEPVTIPLNRSKPQRSLQVIIWTFLGIVTSIGWTLVHDPVRKLIDEIKQ
jgi:uncharacterized protein involved in exopolysaccharide biosynthesis